MVGVAFPTWSGGGEPYWSWYGFPSGVEWCAIFVSWVADQVGLISEGLFPKFAGCSMVKTGSDPTISGGRGYCPAPGEIIFTTGMEMLFLIMSVLSKGCDGGTSILKAMGR